MTTGSDDDIKSRMISVHPLGWFPDEDPVRDVATSGLAWAYGRIWDFLMFVKAQTRLKTTAGAFLDLYALDFFGLRFRRRPGQNDDAFRAAVAKEIVRERVTRTGLVNAVADISGQKVIAWEPWHGGDCGGYDTNKLAYDDTGRWGSLDHPRQIFLDAVQPKGEGIKHSGGFDALPGGLNTAPLTMGDERMISGPVTRADIYRTIRSNKPAGVIVWIDVGEPSYAGDRLDSTFTLDESVLPGGYGL
jgi:hypothetical protein